MCLLICTEYNLKDMFVEGNHEFSELPPIQSTKLQNHFAA